MKKRLLKRGFLLTLEGGEGSGKSTQLGLLMTRLCTELCLEPLFLREPGGTALGEWVRVTLLDPANTHIAPLAEVMLYEVSRAQLVEERITPALEDNQLVIVDRHIDSSEAYQGFGRGLSIKDIQTLNRIATKGLRPDLTVLYDVDTTTGLARATSTDGADRIEAEGPEFHQRVRKGFLNIAVREPERFAVIDGSQGEQQVSDETWQVVWQRLKEVL